jgi:hypothetical protein
MRRWNYSRSNTGSDGASGLFTTENTDDTFTTEDTKSTELEVKVRERENDSNEYGFRYARIGTPANSD